MSRRDAGHATDLLSEHALGMLRGAELRRVERHLRQCATCREELASWQQVADSLAYAPPPVEPSEELRERILGIGPAPAAERSLMRRLAPAWAALGVAALAVSVGFNVALWQRAGAAEALVAESRAVRLVPTADAAGASARLVPTADARRATLVAQGLPPLPPDRQYQLWLIKDGVRVSGGVFSVSPDGRAKVAVRAPMPLATYTGFGVTIEPAGGSPGPTGPRVLAGTS